MQLYCELCTNKWYICGIPDIPELTTVVTRGLITGIAGIEDIAIACEVKPIQTFVSTLWEPTEQ